MNPAIPSIGVVSAAIVLIANSFLGTELVTSNVQEILQAVLVVALASASVYSWFKVRFLTKEMASLKAQMTNSKAVGVKAKKVVPKKKK